MIVVDAEQEIFKKKVKELKKYKGKHTELISLFTPNNADRSSVMNQLTNEVSQSSNIKSATTRKNVQGALRKIIQYLKVTDFKIPKNGLALYCGNISEYEGRPDIELFHVVPIKDLKVKMYRCDSEFYMEPLVEMLAPNDVYGIVAADNKEATIAYLIAKNYKVVARLSSAVPGKIKAGGQSANRFEHLRIEAANEFYERISEKINEVFLPFIEEGKLRGVIFGGPGHTKKRVVERNLIDYRIANKIIGYVDNTYTDESGIKEIIEESADLLKENELIKERQEVNQFFEKVIKTNIATYGFNEVMQALKEGRVAKVFVYEDLKLNFANFECEDCNKSFVGPKETKTCQFCNSSNIDILEELDAGEFFLEHARKTGTEVVFISKETTEGQQFCNAFGGIGAILRY